MFEGANEIFISVIVPDAGPMSGNTRVLVRGTNLQENSNYPVPQCRFGRNDRIVDAVYTKCTPEPQDIGSEEPSTAEKTSSCIYCDPGPISTEEDVVPFSVSIKGDFSDTANSVEFRYY